MRSLTRISEAIQSTWKLNSRVAANQMGENGGLWLSVKASLDDCNETIKRLAESVEQAQKKSFLDHGFLISSSRAVRFNLRVKDIDQFRLQIHSHSNAMQTGFMMIQM